MRPYSWQVALVLVLLTLESAGNLYLPYLNADIINNGVVQGNVDYIWRVGGIMVGIVFALGAIAVVVTYRAARISMRTGADLRAAIYRRVQGFSAAEMNRFGIPSLITRNVNDVQQVQIFVTMTFSLLFMAVIMSIGSIGMAIWESAPLSLLLAVALPVMALVVGVLMVILVPMARAVQVRTDNLNQLLREQITGVRVIRAFLRERSERERFREANAGISKIMLRGTRILALAVPVLLGIANLSSVGVIWFGGRFVSEGSMPIGTLTAFLIYIVQILVYSMIAVSVIMLIPRAVASAERISQVINTDPAITDPAEPLVPAEPAGTVEFRHVSFGYPGSERPVLNDLTFTLRPGQTTAIIGGTGSGKTTLLNLIPRFFETADGMVLIDGVNVREQAVEQLWSSLGLVPQTAFLFAGTVGSNLRFGMPEASDEQLWRALDVAQALDFVASMPGQLDAPVDQGGTNVSGGQRQRLSIARALVRRPRVYLFDDCFSALDAGTDARLRGALRDEVTDATVVIAAQRASTIMHAEQIIVLDAGSIAGIGTHEQLLADCVPYQEIIASQLGEAATV
ncbi:MAG TPA: ABC transporter ATP-binding protein [Streptosporangiaceae bacterium]|jgi:ATP-binding cassette subfamily B protein